MPNELSLEFTTDELYLLYSFFGPAIAFGLGEPYLGKFIEEIETAQQAARQSLVARDLIRLAENGATEMDEALAKMIQTCAQPSDTLIVTTQRKNYNQVIHYFHFGPEILVEHTPRETANHRLVAMPRAAAYARLKKILHLNGQPAAPSGAFSLDEAKLFQARDAALHDNLAEARQALDQAGLAEPHAQQLLRSLANAVSNASIAVIANRSVSDAPQVKGLGIFESAEGLWALNLQPGEKETRIEFVPSSAAEIANRLETLVPLR